MKTTIARFLFSALAIALVGGTLAVAQGPDGMGVGGGFGPHHSRFEEALGSQGRWWNNPRMIQSLKITDEQRKAMDEIMFAHREKLIDLQANLERSELAMEPLMSADQPDRAAMEAQIDKIVTARADLEKANALFLLDIRMKLTPDQWKQLKDMRTHMMERRHDRGPGDKPMWGQGGPGAQHMWRQHPGGNNPPPPPPPPPNGAAPQAPPAGQPQGSGSGPEQ